MGVEELRSDGCLELVSEWNYRKSVFAGTSNMAVYPEKESIVDMMNY